MKNRKSLDSENESNYNIVNFWLDKYFSIRIAETGAEFSKAEYNYILYNSKKIYNIYDNFRAYKFLNDKLKKRHKHLYNRFTRAYPSPACIDLGSYTPEDYQTPQKDRKEPTPFENYVQRTKSYTNLQPQTNKLSIGTVTYKTRK